MILKPVKRLRAALIGCVILILGASQGRVAHASELATGSVGGTVTLVRGLQTISLAGAVLELISISDESVKYQASTDSTGRYTIRAPTGTYKMLLSWMGGDDCSEIHRASFRLDAGANLVFGFLVMQCPFSEPVITKELIEKADKKHVETRPPNPMNVPLNEQTEKYQEQLIPSEQNRWPEIIVSFGKYDNHVNKIRYFPFHQTLINSFAIPNPPVPLSLPVTVTVDRYTLRAESIILEKGTMVFKASGQVSVSDGTTTRKAGSATLWFSSGEPKIELN